MYPLMFPAEPSVEVFVNGSRIGLLQEYSLTEKTEVIPVRGFGESAPACLLSGTTTYALTLKRLLLDRSEIPLQFSPYGLKDFRLVIRDGRRTLDLSGCRWTSVSESYRLGDSLVEELQLSALSCARGVLG